MGWEEETESRGAAGRWRSWEARARRGADREAGEQRGREKKGGWMESKYVLGKERDEQKEIYQRVIFFIACVP